MAGVAPCPLCQLHACNHDDVSCRMRRSDGRATLLDLPGLDCDFGSPAPHQGGKTTFLLSGRETRVDGNGSLVTHKQNIKAGPASTMNKARNLVASGVALGMTALAQAQGTAPAEITTAVDNLTAGFTSIKGLIVVVVTFGIVIGYVKLLRRK